MRSCCEQILSKFTPKVARFNLVADLDRLFYCQGNLTGKREWSITAYLGISRVVCRWQMMAINVRGKAEDVGPVDP